MTVLLLTHAAATWMMVGLIWFVQVVYYPLFAQVGTSVFSTYESDHTRLTTWIVGPPMLLEAATAAFLLLSRPAGVSAFQVWLGALLLVGIWLSTAFLQVPQHTVLTGGFDTTAHRTLVFSNWLRTVAWSLRECLALWMLAQLMRSA
jgi:uncharacterized membrane protein